MPVVVQNRSKTPCHLAGFEINVVINGRLRWTKQAGGVSEEDRFPGWDLTDGRASKRVVRFPGLSRTEVEELLQAPGGLEIAIDIPAASLDVRRYAEPRQKFPLEQVVAKCAVLDLAAPEARRLYVSAIAEDGATGLPLEEFLNRVTPGSTITWKNGPTGDYLALFQDKPGTDLPLPNLRSRGMWLIDWISGNAVSTSAP
ncbi:MAG: hypothetical protein IID44_06740, partial [Planctomycetes bacterium]|nr:hypothetical protein [Planctomycetota bacterium]